MASLQPTEKVKSYSDEYTLEEKIKQRFYEQNTRLFFENLYPSLGEYEIFREELISLCY